MLEQDTKLDPIKRIDQPDIADFGPGKVSLFDFVWTDYLWSRLEAGRSWIVRLKNADCVVVAVLDGELEVQGEDGRTIRTVSAGDLFATQGRILTAKSDSTLFAAPLFQVLPMAAGREAVAGDGRGGPVFL